MNLIPKLSEKAADEIKAILISSDLSSPTTSVTDETKLVNLNQIEQNLYSLYVPKYNFSIIFTNMREDNLYTILYEDIPEIYKDKQEYIKRLKEILGDISALSLSLNFKLGVELF